MGVSRIDLHYIGKPRLIDWQSAKKLNVASNDNDVVNYALAA